jgi:hypothetical protein
MHSTAGVIPCQLIHLILDMLMYALNDLIPLPFVGTDFFSCGGVAVLMSVVNHPVCVCDCSD